jgi:hypothetical protein
MVSNGMVIRQAYGLHTFSLGEVEIHQVGQVVEDATFFWCQLSFDFVPGYRDVSCPKTHHWQ